MKLKDFVNPKKNKSNSQLSLDLKKLKLKKHKIDLDDLLDLDIIKNKRKKLE